MPGVNPFVGLFVAAAALMVALFVPVFSLPIDRGERMAEAPDGDGADGRPAAGRTAPPPPGPTDISFVIGASSRLRGASLRRFRDVSVLAAFGGGRSRRRRVASRLQSANSGNAWDGAAA